MSQYRRMWIVAASVATAVLAHTTYAAPAKTAEARTLARGKYIARIAGCNDCHTPGYAASGGKVPEAQWLVGDKVGWNGPWGTTYPSNLRLYMHSVSESQWVKIARSAQYRPPMPWFALRDMHTQDLRALYRFIKSLGPAGEAAPAYVPPGQDPKGPVITFPAPPK